MEAQISGELTEDGILQHLQKFRHVLSDESVNEMLEQLLQHIRNRVLAGGRPVYFEDTLHIMAAPDQQEPEPSMSASSTDESACTDDIFTSDQHRFLAFFEDLLAQHATRHARVLRGHSGSSRVAQQ